MTRTQADDVLILSRSEIDRLMSFGDYVEAVEAGFKAAAEGRAMAPPRSALVSKAAPSMQRAPHCRWVSVSTSP